MDLKTIKQKFSLWEFNSTTKIIYINDASKKMIKFISIWEIIKNFYHTMKIRKNNLI
jgi:hypothetical protein